jgi:beta-galactosidase/beta-glucuronidase
MQSQCHRSGAIAREALDARSAALRRLQRRVIACSAAPARYSFPRMKNTSKTRSKSRKTRSQHDQHAYPRPQLRRETWTNLNGRWDFAIDADARWVSPDDVRWSGTIQVPFSPETPASGVHDTGFYKSVWYRLTTPAPTLALGQRLILHFGAVDHSACVWINHHLAVTHEGGYTPFSSDITEQVTDGADLSIVVQAFDDPQDLAKPRGKQDWKLQPHGIWYFRTTGIWQTVWMEVVPAARIDSVHWTPDVDRWCFDLRAGLAGAGSEAMRLRVRLRSGERELANDTYSISDGAQVLRSIHLPDPGIDDLRSDLFWSPDSPTLIDAELELLDASGAVVDRVSSYTAMRAVSTQGEWLLLNGRPMQLRLVLDQGYWPDSGLTAPNDDAFRRDIELIKSMGFNGVRKHQKIEDPRFLYWADTLGLVVWEEMPSAYRFSPRTVHRLTQEWMAALERDISHPCIIAWVPFNESWGVPDLPNVPAQRDFVRAVYHLTRALDPTRPVMGNDGWEMVVSDVIAIHDYERAPERLGPRYQRSAENLADLFAHERPGHRRLLLGDFKYQDRPIMLTEFGGIAYSKDPSHTWGYKRAKTVAEFEKQYRELLAAVRAIPLFSGFCYTQFTDTYQEANGLLYMDRTPKIPIAKIRSATAG